ncbi:uncharacterized transporter slc-17.2-like [Neodiprion pinetum]|uniref:uncharacterized transporter slc-17.2-like n=1 Tax=Neodiprion pinetum TaxID=441929 RepID=UPI0037106FBD
MSVTNVRKSLATISSILPAIFIITASYVGCNNVAVVILFVLGTGFMGPYYPAMLINPMDLSPNYSGTVLAMTMTVSALTGIAAPYLVGILTPNQTLSEWRIVFWICFGFFLECALVFVIWGDGKAQYWNDPDFRFGLEKQPVTKVQKVENDTNSDRTVEQPST